MSGVLVTGARGFVGLPLVAQLAAAGSEVHAAGRGTAPHELPDGVRWHQVDLLSEDGPRKLVAAASPETVVHLAWDVEPGRFWRAPENLDWAGATLRLARALPEGTRLVGAGTCAEYDWTQEPELAEARTPLRPATFYGVAKDATRRLLEGFDALEVAWGRIFWLYGPREDPRRLVSSVAQRLVAGERAPVSSGTQRLDLLHVDDVAGAFAALAAARGVTGAVNVASGDAVPVADVVRGIAAAAGGEDRVGWGELPTPEGQPPELRGAVDRLHDEVGFTPRVALQDGLASTVGWWRAQQC